MAKSDLVTATALIGCAALACLPDRAAQSALCRSIAKTHIGLRGSRAETLKTIIPLLDRRISASALEIALLADEYEAVAETWRDYMPWSRPVTGRLGGGAHITAALEAGRGAVLWDCSSGPGSRVALRCLAEAGHKLVPLRSHAHPFSHSRFCRMFLNPMPNHADNRYLESVVIGHDGNNAEAMQVLGAYLAANRVVLVAANGAFSKPHAIRFLGGTLSLGLEAPTLAMRHDAPLIPLFSIADGNGGYDVIAAEPLTGGPQDAPQDGPQDGPQEASAQTARRLADRYAGILERHLKRHPRLWDNWFAEDIWMPAENPNAG